MTLIDLPTEPRRRAVAMPSAPTPIDIVQSALKSGNVDMYREAVALFKELEGMAARKAFDNAMADAKTKIPTIKRNREVDSGGRGPKYRFEDLAEIAKTVDPILSECGLNYRYHSTSRPGEPITITCIISHRGGHREETSLTAGPDTGPGRNPIQQIGSTITYLERYTLKLALGLAVSHDDDGRDDDDRSSGAATTEPAAYTPPAGSITQDQADNIRDALEAKGASRAAFLQWAGKKFFFKGNSQRIEAIDAEHFAACIDAINRFQKV